MKTYKIHLIRHGMTSGNLEGKYVGHLDIPVCEQGLTQLEQMKKDYCYPKVSAVFCSPLKRCIQTAGILYPDMEPVIMHELIEYNFGEFEGKTADELKKDNLFIDWMSGSLDAAPPFGESNREFGERILKATTKIIEGMMKSDTREIAIVSHGGVIMGILSAFGLPELPMPEWMSPNGCGYTILITPTLWTHAQKFEVTAEIPFVVDETFEENFDE